ncbi:MAG: hypothetical protein CSB55_04740 [Candidatus Cloacimonadota bacterium]|nr:MAG: hypothetical protein CSB55_04740 [Candidatus Cloacimonadota bacterium]
MNLTSLRKYFSDKEVIAFLGLSKNAGKTTFLNWFLKNTNLESVGIFSTGRDGEEYDLVGGHEKPKVLIPAGSFYVTFSGEAQFQSPFVDILKKTKFKAGGKNLWIIKALQDLEGEIAGPASVAEQEILAKELLHSGCKHVLIDGALDRKSIALSSLVDDNILVAGATFGSQDEILEELEYNIALGKIPTKKFSFNCKKVIVFKNRTAFETDCVSILGNEKNLIKVIDDHEADTVFIPGALTANSFKILKNIFRNKIKSVIFPHPLHIQMKLNQLNSLIKYTDIFTLEKFPIHTVSVNSFSVSGNHINCDDLRNLAKKKFPEMRVIDVTEAVK